jgi:hypothetical protein
MKTPEARVKEGVRKWLKTIGAYRFSPVQMGIGSPTLDDLCCIFGQFVAIEYKAPGKKLTPRQELTVAAIRRAGGIVVWGDSFESIFNGIKSELAKIKHVTPMKLESGALVHPR